MPGFPTNVAFTIERLLFCSKIDQRKKKLVKKTPLANFRVRIETENKGRHAKPVPAALWFSRWRWNFFLFRQSTQKLFRCHLFADILFKFNFKGAFNKFLPSGKFNQTSICYIYTALNRFGFCLLQDSLYDAPLNDAQPRDRLVLLSLQRIERAATTLATVYITWTILQRITQRDAVIKHVAFNDLIFSHFNNAHHFIGGIYR